MNARMHFNRNIDKQLELQDRIMEHKIKIEYLKLSNKMLDEVAMLQSEHKKSEVYDYIRSKRLKLIRDFKEASELVLRLENKKLWEQTRINLKNRLIELSVECKLLHTFLMPLNELPYEPNTRTVKVPLSSDEELDYISSRYGNR